MKKTKRKVRKVVKLTPVHVIPLLAVLIIVVLVLLVSRRASGQVSGRTYYVSPDGSNSGGTSWSSAWRSFSDINWTILAPGDVVEIDGGRTECTRVLGSTVSTAGCGRVYAASLNISKSNTSSYPITLKLSDDPGRNGSVIIDGGITEWSRCAETVAEPNIPPSNPGDTSTPRETGVNFNNSQGIVLDGTKWGGIEVRNHTRYGINLAGSQNVVVRYVKVHHNTHPTTSLNHTVGITQNYQSSRNTVSRADIFRNGQDALRGAGDYFTLEESYIHDHYCNHPDGIQSFVPTSNGDVPDTAGEVVGLTIRRNVFKDIGMQSVFLGENATHNSWNKDVTIENNLFMQSRLIDGQYFVKSKHGRSTNWRIAQNTFVRSTDFGVEWCCGGATGPMTITRNIFSQVVEGGTGFYLPTTGSGTTFSNNCTYRTGRVSGSGVTSSNTITPSVLFTNALGGDYSIATGSQCAGLGSNITSVATLQSLSPGSPTTAPEPLPTAPTAPTAPPLPTNAPSPTRVPTPTVLPSPTPLPRPISFEAENGSLRLPIRWYLEGGTKKIYQEGTQPTTNRTGGRAVYRVPITSPGKYQVVMSVFAKDTGHNSVFVNFDQDPYYASNPNSIVWDIAPTVNDRYELRTVSHRGSGDETSPQFVNKVFDLSAGDHWLYIRGREPETKIDSIRVVPVSGSTLGAVDVTLSLWDKLRLKWFDTIGQAE